MHPTIHSCAALGWRLLTCPCAQVYTLAEHLDTSTYRIVSPFAFCPAPYTTVCAALVANVVGDRAPQRAAAVIYGRLGSGKTTLCIRSLKDTGFVPLAHQSVAGKNPLHIGVTIVEWFKHCRVGDVAPKVEPMCSTCRVQRGHCLTFFSHVRWRNTIGEPKPPFQIFRRIVFCGGQIIGCAKCLTCWSMLFELSPF